MNTIQGLIDRQLGIYCRLNYDYALKRLVVDSEESFYGLQSANVIPTFLQDPPIFACRFAEAAGYEHILALANEDGRVAIQDTSSKARASKVESFQCHNNAVFDLAWMPGHMNFVTVSGDHTACLWDAGCGAPRQVQVFAGHSRSVKTCVFRPEAPHVFATGARDGHVLVWDTRAPPRPDNYLAACHARFTPHTPGSGKRPRLDAHRAISITGLAFQHHDTLLSCGECDGNIKVWDMRKNYSAHRREPLPKHSIPYCGSSTRNGYSNLAVDRARVRLYASCMDNVVYCFNAATYAPRPERRYVGHENGTFYIKTCLSPDGAYLVSGSSDKHAYVWSVEESRPLVRLSGHRAEVTCAAWSRAPRAALVTCSDDARHMLWRVGPELDRAASPPPAGRAAPPPRREPEPAPPATPGAGPAPARTPASRSKRCLAGALDAAPDAPAAKRARPEPEAGERAAVAGVKRLHDGAPAPAAPRSPERRWSPTRDLPDFVSTGEAPHLSLRAARRRGAAADWLTALSRAKRARLEAATPAPGAVAARRGSAESPARRGSAEKPARARRGALLRYFTVLADK